MSDEVPLKIQPEAQPTLPIEQIPVKQNNKFGKLVTFSEAQDVSPRVGGKRGQQNVKDTQFYMKNICKGNDTESMYCALNLVDILNESGVYDLKCDGINEDDYDIQVEDMLSPSGCSLKDVNENL